ncbi:MAG: alkaline phosphatase [Melioribacteraceae bacterium]
MLRKIFYYMTVAVFLTATFFYARENKPKNVILLIGDGMGLSQVSASSISMQNDQFKKFLSIGLINTCSADKLITDSAAGATAYATGYRTNNGMISVDVNGKVLESILEIARKKKKGTGIIATSSLTNATPAAFISHNGTRKEEFEIASQIVKCGADLLLGAGTDFFFPKELGGKRDDNLNLVDSMKTAGYQYISNPDLLKEKQSSKKILGLFGASSLSHAKSRNYTLGFLTGISIEHLSKNKNGFFLMVEGSQLDWAADANDKDYLFGELKDFNTAVEAALRFAEKDKNTLVIVLADHDTGSLGISGKNKETGELDVVWATKYHTANLVGIFSYGPGSEKFNGIMDNYIVGRKLINLISPEKSWK